MEEPRRALIALEMLYSGDYLTPTIMGELYFAKPPLFNWIIIVSAKLFGSFSEMAVRRGRLYSSFTRASSSRDTRGSSVVSFTLSSRAGHSSHTPSLSILSRRLSVERAKWSKRRRREARRKSRLKAEGFKANSFSLQSKYLSSCFLSNL